MVNRLLVQDNTASGLTFGSLPASGIPLATGFLLTSGSEQLWCKLHAVLSRNILSCSSINVHPIISFSKQLWKPWEHALLMAYSFNPTNPSNANKGAHWSGFSSMATKKKYLLV